MNLNVMTLESSLEDFPEHAAILAIIDRYTFLISPRMTFDTIIGITSYLDGWGPEGAKFNESGISLSRIVADVLVDLDNLNLIAREDASGMYHLAVGGIQYMDKQDFFDEPGYLADIIKLILWYAKSFRGPVLELGDRNRYASV